MKTTKKLVGLLLTLVMALSMTVLAFAANITITDEGGISEYVAYRILNSTNAVDENGQATDKFAYTLNDKYAVILKSVTGETEEAAIVDYISKLDADGMRTFADDVYEAIKKAGLDADATATNGTFSDIAEGYYLIAETSVGAHPDTFSLVMIDTAGKENITVATKEEVPTVEKKVKDKDDSKNTTTGWQDSADYDIGDSIPYKITGTVSSEYASYKTYFYEFVDIMSEGLTYNDDVKVYVINGDVTDEAIAAATPVTGYTSDWSNQTLTVTFNDLKKVEGVTVTADSKIVVTYTATLNEKAVIGAAGNPNDVYLRYNRNPYYDGNGTNTPGETPKDRNIVFTFEGIVNKVDPDNNALKGAGFTLYKFDGEKEEWVEIRKFTAGEDTTFTFTGLDAGQYKLVETEVPAGYNKADDVLFEIYAEHEETAENPKLTKLVVKIGEKTYDGTNEDDPFQIDMPKGQVTTSVVNNSGTELPSTGGMGTTIFYVVGGMMMLFASVILITRRRMNAF